MEADEQQSHFHDDFTTASQWEIFIARIEEALYEWKLPQLKPQGCPTPRNQFRVHGTLQTLETSITFSGDTIYDFPYDVFFKFIIIRFVR